MPTCPPRPHAPSSCDSCSCRAEPAIVPPRHRATASLQHGVTHPRGASRVGSITSPPQQAQQHQLGRIPLCPPPPIPGSPPPRVHVGPGGTGGGRCGSFFYSHRGESESHEPFAHPTRGERPAGSGAAALLLLQEASLARVVSGLGAAPADGANNSVFLFFSWFFCVFFLLLCFLLCRRGGGKVLLGRGVGWLVCLLKSLTLFLLPFPRSFLQGWVLLVVVVVVVVVVVSPRSPSSPQGWAWCSGTGMFLQGCLKQRRREAKGRHGGGYPRYQDCRERRERLPLAPCAVEPASPLPGVSPPCPELSLRCPPARLPCCPPLLCQPVSPLHCCHRWLVARHRRGESDAPQRGRPGDDPAGWPPATLLFSPPRPSPKFKAVQITSCLVSAGNETAGAAASLNSSWPRHT